MRKSKLIRLAMLFNDHLEAHHLGHQDKNASTLMGDLFREVIGKWCEKREKKWSKECKKRAKKKVIVNEYDPLTQPRSMTFE
jgi:hypothetical protein